MQMYYNFYIRETHYRVCQNYHICMTKWVYPAILDVFGLHKFLKI